MSDLSDSSMSDSSDSADYYMYPNYLYLTPTDEMLKIYKDYKPRIDDTGYDLFADDDYYVSPGEVKMIGFGITGASRTGYLLIPRSSICKTPLMMANSVGLIDAGYRGSIMAPVRNIGSSEVYKVEKGTRLFQLMPINNGKPFERVVIVNKLPSHVHERGVNARGTGGFGSTGTR